MEKHVYIAQTNTNWLKKYSLKAHLGKERKNGMQEAAQNVNRLYLTWEKHMDDRLLMN